MNFLIIFMLIWLGTIPVALAKSEPAEQVLAETIIEQVGYAEPCMDAPCRDLCPHGASGDDLRACQTKGCRHWQNRETVSNCKQIGDRTKCTSFTRKPMKDIFRNGIPDCEIINK